MTIRKQVRFEQIRRGTPLQSTAIVENLSEREGNFKVHFRKTAEKVTGLLWTPPPPSRANRQYDGSTGEPVDMSGVITIGRRPELAPYSADLVAILISDNKTLWQITSSDEDWAHVEPVWLVIGVELDRLGFSTESEQSAQEPMLATVHLQRITPRAKPNEGNEAAHNLSREVYFFRGTIARVKSELELSGIKHQIVSEKPAHLIIKIGNFVSVPLVMGAAKGWFLKDEGPLLYQGRVKGRGGGPIMRRSTRRVSQDEAPQDKSNRQTAKGTITVIEHDDINVRLEVELEDDPDKPGYTEVHERWAMLRGRLGDRLSDEIFVQARGKLSPAAAGDQTSPNIEPVRGTLEAVELDDSYGTATTSGQGQQAQRPQPGDAPSGADSDDALPDVIEMKKIFRDYSPTTALEILNALPAAWDDYKRNGGRWGPSIVAKHISMNSTTIGRYLKAVHHSGLKEWKGVPLKYP